MGTENGALRLLWRTKYVQNRTRFYTVRNPALSQTERPRFEAGSFHAASNDRRLLALKRAFLGRRASRRGPFQRLGPPHEHRGSLGDPAYFSQAELVAACSAAAAENTCAPVFWRQICEKIREVRDLLCIHDLLRCVSALVKANHYDRDLFRVLSREFVDDVARLSLEELSELLYCYRRQNVFSCDLVAAVASRVATRLLRELDESIVETPEPEYRGVVGRIREIMPGSRPSAVQTVSINFRPLALTVKHLHYFKYSNPHFYLSIADFLIKHASKMDTRSRLELFIYLDPKLMFSEPSSDADSNQSKKLVNNLLDSVSGNFGPEEGIHHENCYEMGVFLSSQLFREPANSKLAHELCSVCSSSRLVASAISRFVSNCACLGSGWRDSLNSLIAMLSSFSAELLPTLSRLSALGRASPGLKSPFTSSLENLAVDSLLSSIRSLNSCWRLKLGCVDVAESDNRCKLLKFSLEDNNIHSLFLRQFHRLTLSTAELDLLSTVSEAINTFCCHAQGVHNLTCCFESFSALLNNHRALSLSQRLKRDISAATDAVSVEIIKQLVEFDRESLYRVSLSLSATPTHNDTNSQLQHYVKYFPKITRRSHERHHIAISNPFSDVLSC